MSSLKVKLRAAREALSKKDFLSARDTARQALEIEPDDYHAHVFLGISSLELEDFDSCEQAYKRAIELKPELVLAWQGISKFYEHTQQWDNYAVSLERLAMLYSVNSTDVLKCTETIQKLIALRREHGTRVQLAMALKLLLDGSPVFEALANLPPPGGTETSWIEEAAHNTLVTLQAIVTLLEAEEEDVIAKEINKRRTRLDAPSLDQLRKEVKYDTMINSELPSLYNQISSHPNATEDVRHAAEAKLLRHKLDLLQSLSFSANYAELRDKLRIEVEGLVKGVILLNIPDQLAWSLCFDWTDSDTIEGYDMDLLRRYTHIFPSLPLSKVLAGYLAYGDQRHREELSMEPTDRTDLAFETMLEGQEATSESTLACRVLSEIFCSEGDHMNAIKVAQQGLQMVQKQESLYCLVFPRTRLGFDVIIGTSLAHLSPPKYHLKALDILNDVLRQSPDNVLSLLAQAYIFQTALQWKDAVTILERAVEHAPSKSRSLLAQEELAWSRIHVTKSTSELATLSSILSSYNADQKLERSRCLWRIGEGYWMLGGEYRAEAYRFYINSLKVNSTFAPAFASLGTYYLHGADPPDSTRALKCFQKAFELDARETVAAEHLASGFANDGDWNLVEVIARRTIEGDNTNTDLKGFEGQYSTRPKTVWAWKAVGAVELANKNYSAAIHAFNTALRSQPDDHSLWVYLGEAYHKAGRHSAALNSLAQAVELQPTDWVPFYMIGRVKQQGMQYVDAISSFQAILDERPFEVGVLLSKAQAYLELGRSELNYGLSARAASSFVESIQTALKATLAAAGLRGSSWKLIGDALTMLSKTPGAIEEAIIKPLYFELSSKLSIDPDDVFRDIYTFVHSEPCYDHTAELAIAVYSHRLSLGPLETAVAASSHYDLAMALICWSVTFPQRDGFAAVREGAKSSLLQALRLDPTNDLYWITLGNYEFCDHPKVAQHAYIKALELNSKNVTTWTNLGLLYLHHDDTELAEEALHRARVLDPDSTLAWIALALVAESCDESTKCDALSEHSTSMRTHSSLADLWYASRALKIHNTVSKTPTTSLLPAFFILGRYIRQRPRDAYGLQLYGLICEHLGQAEEAKTSLNQAISILEVAYEESESPEVETQFATTSANLARVKLGLSDYQDAIEAYNNALGLLPADDDLTDTTQILRFQSSLGCALAYLKLGDIASAMTHLESAVHSARDDLRLRGLANVLHSQILWILGTSEHREQAEASLLECISVEVEDLHVIHALASMGILTDDESLVDAAISEILDLTLDKRQQLDPRGDIDYLLIQHKLGQENPCGAVLTAQRAVKVAPTNDTIRQEMAILMVQQKIFSTAHSMLAGLFSTPDNVRNCVNALILEAIAGLGSKGGTLSLAQKGVVLAPWELRSWLTLACVGSTKGHEDTV